MVHLLDSEVDQMSGPECAKLIRQRGLQDITIIGVTGNVLPEDISAFKKSGANEVLSKPVTIDEIQNILTERGMI
jgi:CheY-like chemotaxis protein